MFAIYSKDIDGICSAAIMNKYFNDIGIIIDSFISIDDYKSIPTNMIKKNESIYVLNHLLSKKDWNIILSKTKNIVLINKQNLSAKNKDCESDSTSILTWKFFFGIKEAPYIVKIIDDITFDKKKYNNVSEYLKFGLQIEDISPDSNFWIDSLNNIESSINRVLKNGKVITSFYKNSF